jgi:hypothetical protein
VPSGNALSSSTQRVAKWRERKRRGVLFMTNFEVMDRDLRVLKRCGHLTSDDPAAVGKDEFGDALGSLLDGLAKRFEVFEGAATPAKGGVHSAFDSGGLLTASLAQAQARAALFVV